MEGRDVDLAAVGALRQGPRRIGEEAEDLEGRSADACAEIGGVEDPDVGPADTGGGQLRIATSGDRRDRRMRPVLPAMGRRDEHSGPDGSGWIRDHDVARLVADEQGADDPARSDADDADAVGEVVHDPDLVVVERHHGHGLETDGDRNKQLWAGLDRQVEDLEIRIGGRW